jgi:hypothetical protein
MPVRIQRKRTQGWRKPKGAVNCTRPSKWSNPFPVGLYTLEDSLIKFRCEVAEPCAQEIQADLRGKDLMCYCGLDQPCHVDILLEVANR